MVARRVIIGILCMVLMTAIMLRPRSAHTALAASSPSQQAPLTARVRREFTAAAPPFAADRSVGSANLDWRPPPAIAGRNSRRQGYAWVMRQFGTSERTLDQLADGDFVGAISDLLAEANKANPVAIRSLGWIAYRCSNLGPDYTGDLWLKVATQRSRDLSTADAEWFMSMVKLQIADDRQLSAACPMIDNATMSQLRALAEQGDAASEFILMRPAFESPRQAALDGFPQAELEYAWALLGVTHQPDNIPPDDPSALDLLRSAAENLPMARANLAVCEYLGCAGASPDPVMALADARAAAQQGYPYAMVSVGSQLPLSMIPADESEAWALFEAALEERGCADVEPLQRQIQTVEATFASPKATPNAQRLATDYWLKYGATAMAQRGC